MAYREEMHRCQQELILRAVLDARGNQCAVAKAMGIHRNTIGRVMREAGYTSKQLKAMALVRIAEGIRKPPASEPAPRAEAWRIA